MTTPDEALRMAAAAIVRASDRNANRWERAQSVLSGAATVWVTGLGKSALVARKLASTLASFHRRAHYLHPVDAFHGDAGAVAAGDVLVAISASGRTAEVLRLVRDLGIPVIALTASGSPLDALAAATLDVSVEAEAGGDAPTTSFAVAVVVADALALSVRTPGALHHPGGFLGLQRRRVGELMLPPPIVPADTLLSACIPRLAHGAVLVDGGGIFTDGDLRRAVGNDANALSRPVGELCTRSPVTVSVDDPCSAALERMERRASQITVLPVVDDQGAYVGLIRLHDLIRAGIGP